MKLHDPKGDSNKYCNDFDTSLFNQKLQFLNATGFAFIFFGSASKAAPFHLRS